MAKKYTPKKIEIGYEVVDAPVEVIQARVDDAFDVLFEETLRFLNDQKIDSDSTKQTRQTPNYQNQTREGVIINA